RWGAPCSTSPSSASRPARRRPSSTRGSKATPGSISTSSAPAARIWRARSRSCMSSDRAALLSATFWEPGYQHLIETVHQRDTLAHRNLDALQIAVHDPEGATLGEKTVDPRTEVVDLSALIVEIAGAVPRAMVTLDARYDERVFPYRPHHYALLHR